MTLVSHARRATRGFTLIELLVVIAIIALLAAILFPVFASAREKARQTACLSNINQVGKACFQYSQDYDEVVLPQLMGTLYWPSLAMPYVGGNTGNARAGVFNCPTAGTSSGAKWSAPNPQYVDVTKGSKKQGYCQATTGDGSSNTNNTGSAAVGQLSYARNAMRFDQWTSSQGAGVFAAVKITSPRFGFNPGIQTSGKALVEAQIEDPAGTIHIVDGVAGSNSALGSGCGSGGSSIVTLDSEANLDYTPDAETAKPAYRHSGGFNALYGDGHTKWRKYGTTTPCDWSVQADPYPTDSAAIVAACKKS